PWTVVSTLLGQITGSAAVASTIVNLTGSIVISSLVTGALTFAISERYLERQTSIAGSYRSILGARVFWPLLGAMIVKTVVLVAPFLATIFAGVFLTAFLGGAAGASWAVIAFLSIVSMVPGIVLLAYLAARLALVEPAVVLEQSGASTAIARSWNLLRGSVAKAFWLLVLVMTVTLLVYLAIAGPTQIAITMKLAAKEEISRSLLAIHTVLTTLVQTLVAPWMSIAAILLYYDQRIRKEGFDLELLARELDKKTRAFQDRGATSLPQEQTPQDNNQ
ncbi:MAG: glycerophosphoryl diester phosphodiesterase membrane domain-containing protein, partial [Armatimonadetes bacterium]|nr:glycerophosphoryl diester phosphodiesterase membrane domain-containing protein [Armatimonadota bacterium]